MKQLHRTLVPRLGLFAALLLPGMAEAQDSDGDGAADAADAYPCDSTRASVSFFPGQSTSALLAFEDQWPGDTDVDFNDVAVRAHYRLERNAAGNVVQLVAVFDPVALGGDLSNGLGLQLPTSRTGVTVRRRIGGGAWESVGLEGDANATMILSNNLRELYANASGRINSRANEARQSGQRLEVEVTFATAAAISQAAAPFDLFVFRSGNLSHQIHFPQYAGTAAMNAALFNTDQDGSSATRRFVHVSGVPAALNLMTSTRYPLEGVGISALFPDIAGFASSGGAQNGSFYASNVVSAQGHDVAALALPTLAAADTACAVPPASCRHIRDAQPGAASGVYSIDPDGAGGEAGFSVYCDMVNHGGGWTLVFKNADINYSLPLDGGRRLTTAPQPTILDTSFTSSRGSYMRQVLPVATELLVDNDTTRMIVPLAYTTRGFPMQGATYNEVRWNVSNGLSPDAAGRLVCVLGDCAGRNWLRGNSQNYIGDYGPTYHTAVVLGQNYTWVHTIYGYGRSIDHSTYGSAGSGGMRIWLR
jgi:LruC domain-containing protein